MHAFDGGDFSERGEIEVSNYEDGITTPSIAFTDTIFQGEDVLSWKTSVRRNGLYTIRLQNTDTILETTIPSCFLTKNSREKLTLHSDRSGHLMGIGYETTRTTCKNPEKLLELSQDTGNLVSGVVKLGKHGESPLIEEIEEIQPNNQERKPQQQQGFLGKYWWVIVVMVILSRHFL